ncbi:unnamed protein product [Nezara viridula]|uniref:Carboxylesterase type B domain-containing protein n=1 Tax=Nezara viridula TaxID=85310 RepID=A0A9P0MUB1_NEZVI|nr:unnamed protein product [Nezara viridula]
MMSGAANAPWSLARQPWRYARQLARHANCSWEQSHAHLLKCLRERPLSVLMSVPVDPPQFATTFGPSVDGVVIDTGIERQSTLTEALHPIAVRILSTAIFLYHLKSLTSKNACTDIGIMLHNYNSFHPSLIYFVDFVYKYCIIREKDNLYNLFKEYYFTSAVWAG